VESLLHDLLNDLLYRCRHLDQELAKIASVPPEISSYRTGAIERVRQVEIRIARLLEDPDIKEPSLAKNYLHDYKRLEELVRIIEWGPVMAITRYSERDRLATLMCHQIIKEVNYPFDPPICMALSAQHYWTDPQSNLIAIPTIEPFHLLGLSDIYHEIGHIVLFRKQREIEVTLRILIDRHFKKLIRDSQREGKPDTYRRELEFYREIWKREWALEFASDIIATYLVGPAYGWTNVRLCANVSTDIYGNEQSHPADAARTQTIGIVLTRLGLGQASAEIQKSWNQLVAVTGQVQPQDFELRFPSELIDEICTVVIHFCEDLSLTAYGHEEEGNPAVMNLTRLLNEAWSKFISDARTFSDWERSQVNQLKSTLGL
jgi:hypothetical protein